MKIFYFVFIGVFVTKVNSQHEVDYFMKQHVHFGERNAGGTEISVEFGTVENIQKAFSFVKKGVVTAVEKRASYLNESKQVMTVRYKITVSDSRYSPYWLKDLFEKAIKERHGNPSKMEHLKPDFPGQRSVYVRGENYFVSVSTNRNKNFWYAVDFCRLVGGRVVSSHLKDEKLLELSNSSTVWISDWDFDYGLDYSNRNKTICQLYSGTRGRFSSSCGRLNGSVLCQKSVEKCFTEIKQACHRHEKCKTTNKKFECLCNEGYAKSGKTGKCQDVDECKGKAKTCHELANCTNTDGGYNCTCPAGYLGNGFTCKRQSEATVQCEMIGSHPQLNKTSLKEHCRELATVKEIAKLATKSGEIDMETIADRLSEFVSEALKNKSEITKESIRYVVIITDQVNKKTKSSAVNETKREQEEEKRIQAFRVVTALQDLAQYVVVQPNETVVVETETVKLQISSLDAAEAVRFRGLFNETSFDDDVPSEPPSQTSVSAILSALSHSNGTESGKNNAIFLAFDGAASYPEDDSHYKPNQVLSVQLAKRNLFYERDVLKFNMTIPPGKNKTIRYFRCGFLRTDIHKWSFDGCRTTSDTFPPSCTCDHLTNFAVLVQTKPIPRNFALDIFGTVGCSLSAISLALTVIILTCFEKLRKKMSTKLHLNLGITMMLAYVTFLFGVERPRPYFPCIAVAATIHFGLLASWGWMAVESHLMYKKFVTVFYHPHKRYILNACMLVYGISAAIVGATVGITVGWFDHELYENWTPDIDNDDDYFPSEYVSDLLCWLHGPALYYGFLAPVAVVFLANTFTAVPILYTITYSKNNIRSSRPTGDILTSITRMFTVSVLLGLSWIFAVFVAIWDDALIQTIFGWLFAITNSMKGFFIFVLFCVRYKESRDAWWPKVKEFICCTKREVLYVYSLDTTRLSTPDRVRHIIADMDARKMSYM